jgi:uncharacterized small protein (DUF1192 family)
MPKLRPKIFDGGDEPNKLDISGSEVSPEISHDDSSPAEDETTPAIELDSEVKRLSLSKSSDVISQRNLLESIRADIKLLTKQITSENEQLKNLQVSTLRLENSKAELEGRIALLTEESEKFDTRLEQKREWLTTQFTTRLKMAQTELEQIRNSGLTSMFKWIEQFFEVIPSGDIGQSGGPRTISIDDLIECMSITDPDGIYISTTDDPDELIVHLPWISDSATITQTASTLTLAVVSAIAESRPLASNVANLPITSELTSLIELLKSSVPSPRNPFAPQRYSDLAKFAVIGLSHAEFDDQYAKVDHEQVLRGIEGSVSEWMNIVLPQFVEHENTGRDADFESKLDLLPKKVVTDWMVGDNALAQGSEHRYPTLISRMSDQLEGQWSEIFEQQEIAVLKYWLNSLHTSISRADDESIGTAMVIDLTYRLGSGSISADW